MTLRAVVFDMDGLLIDSERVILECWRAEAAAQSLLLDDALWLSVVGLHEAGCRELLQGVLGAARAQRLTLACHRRYDQLLQDGLPLKHGANELLQWLCGRGVPLAIATSSRRDRAQLKLARSGIDGYFKQVVTSSDVVQAKPAPDIYQLAAQRLGVPPTQCVALEDSEFGVRAASAAGLRVIQVPDLVPASELSRSLATVVASLHQARPLLESWLGGNQQGHVPTTGCTALS